MKVLLQRVPPFYTVGKRSRLCPLRWRVISLRLTYFLKLGARSAKPLLYESCELLTWESFPNALFAFGRVWLSDSNNHARPHLEIYREWSSRVVKSMSSIVCLFLKLSLRKNGKFQICDCQLDSKFLHTIRCVSNCINHFMKFLLMNRKKIFDKWHILKVKCT